MVAIITNNLRIKNAKDFLENLVDGAHVTDRNHYLFIGRSRPWPISLVNPITNELQPPIPQDTIRGSYAAWDAALAFKKIVETYTSLVIPRHDWDSTGDTIYKPYDDNDSDLFFHPTPDEIDAADLDATYTAGSFYVMTDEFHVFKCLSNNNNAHSTIKPTLPLSAPYVVSTADGYQWKYMFTVSPSQILRFLTDQWIPVHTLGDIADDGSVQWDVEQSATPGSLDSFIIDNQGSGYTNVHSGTAVSGTSTTIVLPAGASAVDSAYVGAEIFITGGTGSGQSRKITAYVGASRTATVATSWGTTPNGTSIYEIWPALNIVGSGSNASAKLQVYTSGPNLGKLEKVVILNAGTGYTYAECSITGGGGSGGSVRPVLAPPAGHGFDAEKELGAYFAMLDVRLEYNEGSGDFPISNDYRQIGVVRDLKDFDGNLSTATTRIATKALLLTGVSDGLGGPFQPDEDFTGTLGPDTATGKVIEYIPSVTPGEGTLHFWQDAQTGFNDFQDTMSLVGGISGATGTVDTSGVVDPEVEKNSGDILYIEHRRPILRAPDQIEDLKIIIEF